MLAWLLALVSSKIQSKNQKTRSSASQPLPVQSHPHPQHLHQLALPPRTCLPVIEQPICAWNYDELLTTELVSLQGCVPTTKGDDDDAKCWPSDYSPNLLSRELCKIAVDQWASCQQCNTAVVRSAVSLLRYVFASGNTAPEDTARLVGLVALASCPPRKQKNAMALDETIDALQEQSHEALAASSTSPLGAATFSLLMRLVVGDDSPILSGSALSRFDVLGQRIAPGRSSLCLFILKLASLTDWMGRLLVMKDFNALVSMTDSNALDLICAPGIDGSLGLALARASPLEDGGDAPRDSVRAEHKKYAVLFASVLSDAAVRNPRKQSASIIQRQLRILFVHCGINASSVATGAMFLSAVCARLAATRGHRDEGMVLGLLKLSEELLLAPAPINCVGVSTQNSFAATGAVHRELDATASMRPWLHLRRCREASIKLVTRALALVDAINNEVDATSNTVTSRSRSQQPFKAMAGLLVDERQRFLSVAELLRVLDATLLCGMKNTDIDTTTPDDASERDRLITAEMLADVKIAPRRSLLVPWFSQFAQPRRAASGGGGHRAAVKYQLACATTLTQHRSVFPTRAVPFIAPPALTASSSTDASTQLQAPATQQVLVSASASSAAAVSIRLETVNNPAVAASPSIASGAVATGRTEVGAIMNKTESATMDVSTAAALPPVEVRSNLGPGTLVTFSTTYNPIGTAALLLSSLAMQTHSNTTHADYDDNIAATISLDAACTSCGGTLKRTCAGAPMLECHEQCPQCSMCHNTLGTSPGYELDGAVLCKLDYLRIVPRATCATCMGPIAQGAPAVAVARHVFHLGHCRCSFCDCALPTEEQLFVVDDSPACMTCERKLRSCVQCGGALQYGTRAAEVVTVLGSHCHAECLSCTEPLCGQSLVGADLYCDSSSAAQASLSTWGRLPLLCKAHYTARMLPTCAGCMQTVDQSGWVTACNREWHARCFACCLCGDALAAVEFVLSDDGLLPQCIPCAVEAAREICAECHLPIESEGVRAAGVTWHAACFTCHACHAHISDDSYYEKDGLTYDEACFAALFCPPCTACEGRIVGFAIRVRGQLGSLITLHPECCRCSACGAGLTSTSCCVGTADQALYCPEHAVLGAPMCRACGSHISSGSKSFLVAGEQWHAACVQCSVTGCTATAIAEAASIRVVGDRFLCGVHFRLAGGLLCSACGDAISPEEDAVTLEGSSWHAACAQCARCKKQFTLDDDVFQVVGALRCSGCLE